MSEGISYLAGAELPAVLVDVQRAGPGLGNIWPEQSDYNMVVKGGGHGNYRNIVLAPNSAQEMCDFTCRAFELAERYRMTVFILADAYVGQMMEPVAFPEAVLHTARSDWAVYADAGSRENLITSILMNRELLAEHNQKLQQKYSRLEEEISEYQEIETEDAELLFIAYGIGSRLCHSAVAELRRKGIKAGMLRPITLYPFPSGRIAELAAKAELFVALELSNGQMADDVELALKGRKPLLRYTWMGGVVPEVSQIVSRSIGDLEGVHV